MYKVCGSRLLLNFEIWPTVDRNCHLREFAVFKKKYLGLCGCNGTDFTTTVNCRNSKTEIQIEIILK